MKGFALWFTGLSGAGKSTLARKVEEVLLERGMHVEVLDGDEIRENLSKELGFSKEDRDTNIRRIGFVAKLLSRNGAVAITAAISPYRSLRREMRASMERFVEVFVECPIEVLSERDVKGLYKKALAGEIEHFTGISDPYEVPENAEVVVHSGVESEDESAAKVIKTLELMNYIPKEEGSDYDAEEEEAIKSRLSDLGYI
jgi:adenylyl-sulfate kinase